MKKIFWKIVPLLCVVTLILLLLAGCGGQSAKPGDGAAKEQETIKLRVAGQEPTEHPATQSLMELKERVEKETDGRIQIEIYPANQLGDYTLVYEEIMKGTIDMALITIPSQYNPKLELVYLHYLAETYEKAKEVYARDSFLYNTMDKLHEELGVKFLGFHVEGFGGILATKEPTAPADPTVNKNLLLRVPPMDIFKVNADDLGYKTVSIAYAELYSALQTGVAEGASGLPPVAVWNGYRDITKFYYQYNNFFENTSFVMNLDLWNSLNSEDQKIIGDAVIDISMHSFDISAEKDQEYRDKLAEAGVKVIEFTEEELTNIAEYSRKITWPKLTDKLGKDVVEGLMKQY